MAIATYDDANLVLRLYELRAAPGLREARKWFVANARFRTFEDLATLCPPGSQEDAYFRQVSTYWNMAAGFVASGVLHHELFFRSGREMLLVWIRLEPILGALRKSRRDPTAYEDLEHVARQFIEWMNRNAPGSFDSFVERLK